MRRVLVLDVGEILRRDLLLGLRGHGIEAEAVDGAADLLNVLGEGTFGFVVLGPAAGPVRELIPRLAGLAVPLDIVALIEGDAERGLTAVREGAADFVPVSSGTDAVASALRKIEARKVFAARQTAAAIPRVRPESGEGAEDSTATVAIGAVARRVPVPAPVLIGNSAKIVALLAMVRRMAGVRAGVLVGGESGTGKELVAQALHDQSPWRAGPFVAVNCGAIPAGLIESELFGHVRGAFTDAIKDKRGLFEAAHGGTLFLDEIADLPLGLQSKLLRVLQDGIIRRVGDVDDLRVEVRVVAATARDLANEVRAGRFREDLYYRLNGLSVHLPPLRDRRDDVPLLSAYFLSRARARLGLPVSEIDADALSILGSYGWPGNVRELENTIERAAVLCSSDRIDVASLPERMLPSGTAGAVPSVRGAVPTSELEGLGVRGGDLSIKRASRRSEEELIRRALAVTMGNRTRAAELLEISHRALLYKIKEYGIVVHRRAGGSGPIDHGTRLTKPPA
jgi:two-component system, NtrC family, response regulator AtoC